MANVNFKVRHGLDIGDNVTITDAGVVTGITDISIDNVNINGNTISSTNTDGNVEIAPNGTGDVYLTADTVRVGDSNANATITTNGTGDLILNTNGGTDSGSITIADGLNGDMTLATNGTGKVIIAGDLQVDGTVTTINSTTLDVDDINITIGKGSPNAAASDGGGITLEGPTTPAAMLYEADDDSWNFNKKTTAPELQVDNININGNTIISTDTNGNITLDPNGTGNIALTLANGGNATNTHNYVFGAIRNATTQNNGNIWAINQSTNTLPYKGISLDNSGSTAVGAATLIRTYSNIGGFGPRVVFERSRGTAASPVTLNSGDTIGGINFTGYQGSGWFNDSITTTPAVLQVTAAEAWSSNTNVGTTFSVSMAPTATTISSGANLVTGILHNPQTATYRSDAFTFRQGKTSATDLLTLGTTSSTLKAKNITFQDTSNAINNVLFTAGDPAGSTFIDRIAQIKAFSAITNTGEATTMTFQSARYNTGTAQYSPTQNGDEIGTFFFNGNYNTGATTAVNSPTARFGAKATETWTSTANGGRFYVETIETGTTTSSERMSLSNTEASINSDTIYLRDSSGTNITGNKIDYRRTFGCFHKNANVTAAAADTVYEFDWTTDTSAHVNTQGITVSNTSRLNFDTGGDYKVGIEMQVKNTDNSERTAYVWLAKNGTDIAESMVKLGIRPKGSADQTYYTFYKEWLVDGLAANDYLELRFAVDNTSGISLEYNASQTTPYARPASPSAVLTITPVGA